MPSQSNTLLDYQPAVMGKIPQSLSASIMQSYSHTELYLPSCLHLRTSPLEQSLMG